MVLLCVCLTADFCCEVDAAEKSCFKNNDFEDELKRLVVLCHERYPAYYVLFLCIGDVLRIRQLYAT